MALILKTPRRQILGDDVYEQLKALIMDSSIEPGARLNIEDLDHRRAGRGVERRDAYGRSSYDNISSHH